ncbi:hydrogenase maturation protease [Natronobacterium gregoryi]|uniref:Hydrogenase maturation protease n=2 Tax=Natronobacterium gregoryi TaxID=44930 RepID=L0ALS2_NATGS|nr:hydrogenase maturation protease [Natronobacterium gregoryi]AFZ74005.1 Ni,Fe-hydrogenase maturation factor [Natronobacterium gregoryi SP2]ELY70577.1 hydrogenase maturation protease [Natronobacterium gregoryi SP2]PLK20754.1 hydrogenase maturation protease [Natronobacterium gregoryi SP2]SFJ07950.1 hydrogenase maturation protease [Natronobacterium gregoryi]
MTTATLVLGLGNPTRGDDRVGLEVVAEVETALADLDVPSVDVRRTILSDVRLLDLIAGYDRVVVVDAVPVEPRAAGSWWHVDADEVAALEQSSAFAHGLSFGRLVSMARAEPDSPASVEAVLVGIERESTGRDTLSETLSPEIRSVVEPARDAVLSTLEGVADHPRLETEGERSGIARNHSGSERTNKSWRDSP